MPEAHETRQPPDSASLRIAASPGALAKLTARFFLGGMDEHEVELQDGLHATLERLKAVAEA